MNLPATIFAAIDTQLATVDFPTADIAFLNVTYRPKAGVPYLRASTAALLRKALTLGTDSAVRPGGYMAQWTGTYMVDVVWPEDAGIDGCAQMQGKILRLFPRGATLSSSDGMSIVFDAPTPMIIRPDNAWVRGPVQCPWYSFEPA